METGSLAGWRLRFTLANGGPQTQPDPFTVKAGQLLAIPADGVLANDSDPDDDILVARLAGQPKNGTVTVNADGSFSYVASRKAKGTDSFTYLATDASGLSALESVNVEITKAKKKKRR